MAEKIGEIPEDSNPNLHSCDFSLNSENLGSSCSLSLPSEPPDIRNWFSSYIYESPESDTQDDFKCLISRKSENQKRGFDFEEIDREKEENLGDIRSLRERDASDFDEKISFSPSNKGNNHVGQHESLEGKLAISCDLDLLKDDLKSWLNNGDSLQKSERKSSSEDLLKMQDCKRDHCKEVEYILSESNADSRRINTTSPKNLFLLSKNEEEEGKSFANNGFISTKKKKDTSVQGGRSSKRMSQENRVECVRNRKMVSRVGRKPLSERSNLENEVEEREMVGKWRCPQKSKPELGPPLKQLRLQRWLHRI